MQNQINTTPITMFIQQVRSAELTQAKAVSIDIQKARLLVLSLTELLDKVSTDYEKLFNELKQSAGTEVVTVSMDGGGFESSKK